MLKNNNRKHLFGLTRKKISSNSSAVLARFKTRIDTEDNTIKVSPVKHIRTGNLSGQGRKYVNRYISVVRIQKGTPSTESTTIFKIEKGGNEYTMELFYGGFWDSDFTFTKKILNKFKTNGELPQFCKDLIFDQNKAILEALADGEECKIVLLLNRTPLGKIHGMSVDYDTIIPLNYFNKEVLKGEITKKSSKKNIKAKLNQIFETKDKGELNEKNKIKERTNQRTKQAAFNAIWARRRPPVVASPRSLVSTATVGATAAHGFPLLTPAPRTEATAATAATAPGLRRISTSGEPSAAATWRPAPVSRAAPAAASKTAATLRTSELSSSSNSRAPATAPGLRSISTSWEPSRAAASSGAAAAASGAAASGAALGASGAPSPCVDEFGHSVTVSDLLDDELEGYQKSNTKLYYNLDAYFGSVNTNDLNTVITKLLEKYNDTVDKKDKKNIFNIINKIIRSCPETENKLSKLSPTLIKELTPLYTLYPSEESTHTGGNPNPISDVTKGMFVITNSIVVPKEYQSKIGYYPSEQNKKMYGKYQKRKVYVIITKKTLPRSFGLMSYYLEKVFEELNLRKPRSMKLRGGSKKINYKQVVGGLKELYTTNPMAAKAKTRKMIKLLKNMQS